MRCVQCQAESPADAKFCMQCGGQLGSRCPGCGAELPTEARFCPGCGHQLSEPEPEPMAAEGRLHQYIPEELLAKLESARAAGGMQGERRIVTMLFCDVQGSTAAAEKLDPEEWADIMNGAFEHLIAPVYRYEGTLARLMGDAVLAFWRPDHPRRRPPTGRVGRARDHRAYQVLPGGGPTRLGRGLQRTRGHQHGPGSGRRGRLRPAGRVHRHG